jgi:hypothetical protein
VLGAVAAAAEPSGTRQFMQRNIPVEVGRTHSSSAASEYCNGEKRSVMARKTVMVAMPMTSNWDLALVHPVVIIIKQSIDQLNNVLQSRSRFNSRFKSSSFPAFLSSILSRSKPRGSRTQIQGIRSEYYIKFIHEQLAI